MELNNLTLFNLDYVLRSYAVVLINNNDYINEVLIIKYI